MRKSKGGRGERTYLNVLFGDVGGLLDTAQCIG